MCAVHYSDQWKSCQITELKFKEGFQVISYFLDFCSLSAVLLICIPHHNFSPPSPPDLVRFIKHAGRRNPHSHLHVVLWGLRSCGWIQPLQLWNTFLPLGLWWKPVCCSGYLPLPGKTCCTIHPGLVFSLFMNPSVPQEEDLEVEGVEFNVLRAFHHELRVDALAWSPESRLDRLPIIRYWFTLSTRPVSSAFFPQRQWHHLFFTAVFIFR